jgi:hypothetical protein
LRIAFQVPSCPPNTINLDAEQASPFRPKRVDGRHTKTKARNNANQLQEMLHHKVESACSLRIFKRQVSEKNRREVFASIVTSAGETMYSLRLRQGLLRR